MRATSRQAIASSSKRGARSILAWCLNASSEESACEMCVRTKHAYDTHSSRRQGNWRIPPAPPP
eukprot:scaffold46379_cov37-Tisochrysis_lutea.AAC.1